MIFAASDSFVGMWSEIMSARLFTWLAVVLAVAELVSANSCTAAEIPNLLANHATTTSCWTVIVVNRQKVPWLQSPVLVFGFRLPLAAGLRLYMT